VEEENKNIVRNQKHEEAKDTAQTDYDQGKQISQAGDKALQASCVHNALVGFEQNGDDKGVANASDQLGDICALREEHEKAIEPKKMTVSVSLPC